MGRQAFGTRIVYRETFLQIQPRLLQHLTRKSRIHGVLIYRNKITHHRQGRIRIKHQFKIRDASPDRHPKIQSSLVCAHRQFEGQSAQKRKRMATVGLRISGHRAPGIFTDFTEEHKSRRVRLTKATQRNANIREKQRSVARKNSCQSSSSAQPRTL